MQLSTRFSLLRAPRRICHAVKDGTVLSRDCEGGPHGPAGHPRVWRRGGRCNKINDLRPVFNGAVTRVPVDLVAACRYAGQIVNLRPIGNRPSPGLYNRTGAIANRPAGFHPAPQFMPEANRNRLKVAATVG